MSFHNRYELEQLIFDGPTQTFQASQSSTGHPVYMHLLGGIGNYAVLESLLRKARWLQKNTGANGAGSVLEVGEDTTSPYIVTDVLPSFSGLETWVNQQCEAASRASFEHSERELNRLWETGDYVGAFEMARAAVIEFPDSEPLLELEEKAKLICRGTELCRQGKDEKGLESLWQAHKLDEANPRIRAVLVNTLLDRAQSLSLGDPAAANQLVEAARRLDPGHAEAQSLHWQASPQQDDFGAWCVTEARRLKSAGDLRGAQAILKQGLAKSPNDPALVELQRALEGPASVEEPPKSSTAPQSEPQTPAQVPEEPGPEHSSEQERSRVRVGGLLRLWKAMTAQLFRLWDAFLSFLEKKLPALAPFLHRLRSNARLVAVTFSVGAVLVLLAAGWFVWNRTMDRFAVVQYPITIQSSPIGATVFVDGKECGPSPCEMKLEPGSYRAEARLPGYQAAAVGFGVGEEGVGDRPVELILQPLAPSIRIGSDLSRGRIWLDDEQLGELQDGEFVMTLDDLPAGLHTLKIADRSSSAELHFHMEPGFAPVIEPPVETNNLKVVAVASLGPRAYIYSSLGEAEATINGESCGALMDGELEVRDLTEGSHELAVGQDEDSLKLAFESGLAPVLTAHVISDRNVGALQVRTKEDGATVYLNGSKYRRKTSRGGLVLWLTPRTYRVRVEKPGFKSPPERVAKVVKGERVRLEFDLEAEPQTAVLHIRDGVPGSVVSIDGQSLGSIEADGTFTAGGISPGEHVILLRKRNYHNKEVRKEFLAGETLELAGDLRSALGTLQIQISPEEADARVILRREGENLDRFLTDHTLTLAEGSYTITATAPGYEQGAATVQVNSGETRTVKLALKRPKPKEKTLSTGLAAWETRGGWQRLDDTLVRQGGRFVLGPVEPQDGVYEFSAMIVSGRRLRWVVNFYDENNYELFELSKDHFHRLRVSNGDKSRGAKTRHSLGKDGFFSVRVEISGDFIVHYLLENGRWREIDRWGFRGARFTMGKFGFFIPEEDQISLAEFKFKPQG